MFLTSLSSDKTFKKSVKNVNTNNTIKNFDFYTVEIPLALHIYSLCFHFKIKRKIQF